MVLIASINSNTNSFIFIDTSYVDSTGSYKFYNLPYGTYDMLSLLLPGSKYFNGYVPHIFMAILGTGRILKLLY